MTASDDGLARMVPHTAGSVAGPARDLEEERHARAQRIEAVGRWVMPVLVLSLAVLLWDRVCVWNEIPHYILLVTLQITLMALLVAVIGGVGLAVLFTQSRFAEMSFYPFAVILQVTPIVSVAPLIFIYVESKIVALLLCAWIVAFFPILASTTLGLKSADHNLRDLFTIYRASRWQRLRLLHLPSALPYFLSGLRIAGGLALIGAVVAEYVAGTGGIGSGLAFRILEAGYRLNIPRMFAALLLIAAMGVAIFGLTSLASHLLLRKWHESALKRES
jgi:NitT/TauT family transport system permease protein